MLLQIITNNITNRIYNSGTNIQGVRAHICNHLTARILQLATRNTFYHAGFPRH